MYLRNLSVFLSIFILSAFIALSQGVNLPQEQEFLIAGISVSGNEFADPETIISLSGLRVNSKIKLVNDFSVQRSVQNLWKRKQFSSVNIIIDKVTSSGVFLEIQVKEFPRLNEIIVKNNKKLDNFEIIKGAGKIRGDIISNNDIQKSKESIKKLYEDEGISFAKIDIELIDTDTLMYKNMVIYVEEGVTFKVRSIEFEGNKDFTDSDLESAFDDTKTKSWWQIWKTAKFDKKKYVTDKDLLLKFLRSKGYIDAMLLKDTVIYNVKDEVVDIQIKIDEGPKVYIRNIDFDGNTVYSDESLFSRLEFKKGDFYNVEKFSKNLSGNDNQTDAASLYLDNGYLQARLTPELYRVPPDSVDITVRVFESERFRIGKVEVVGNTKTKDKVIRRELYTRPGDYFDRSAVIRSIRALQVMQYFAPETLRPDIKPSETDNTAVDLIYKVEERSTDTFNASIGFAGSFGLTGAVGFTFNNFSIMEPLKGGGGQIFNFNAEFGQANRYQTFSLGLTEPWLFDEPTTVGFNLFDSYYRYLDLDQSRTGISINLGRRFKWPDDYWRGDWSFRAQVNDNKLSSIYYRAGKYTEITIGQRFSRISINNMFFPTNGSKFTFGSDVALGAFAFGLFGYRLQLGQTDYFKNELSLEIYNPLAKVQGNDRLVLLLATKMGYITGFFSDTTISPIELYRMGGNGLSGFGVTPLRGYPDSKIGNANGNKVMMKYTAELRFALSLDPMPIYFYGFAEAGNVWDNLKTTDPFDLKRSAGLGIQLMVNPIGVIGFSYGYGFDKYDAEGEVSGWRFLFHLGQ